MAKRILPLGDKGRWIFFCPACECGHCIKTDPNDKELMGNAYWTFNGDQDKPTIRASILVFEGKDNPPFKKQHRCHSFVTDGKIEYLGDCTHKMAGQTVELPDMEHMGEGDLIGKDDNAS